jgi:hypothetical protein
MLRAVPGGPEPTDAGGGAGGKGGASAGVARAGDRDSQIRGLTRYNLGITLRSMETMTIKRHTLHLDEADMKALARLADKESKQTGIRVTAAGMIRRLIKEHLREQSPKK